MFVFIWDSLMYFRLARILCVAKNSPELPNLLCLAPERWEDRNALTYQSSPPINFYYFKSKTVLRWAIAPALFLLFLNCVYMCVCMWACKWECRYPTRPEQSDLDLQLQKEVRGKLVGIGPILPSCRSWDWWQVPLHNESERCFKETYVSYITILNCELGVGAHERGWRDQ